MLSREEKLARIALLEERQRRDKLKKPAIVPNAGQAKVLLSDHTIRICTAGNGGGKTVLAICEAVWTAQGFHPLRKEKVQVPNKVMYVLDRPSKVGDKVMTEMKRFFDTSAWKWHKDGTPSYRRVELPNGSEIIFGFHEADAMSWESTDGWALCVYDEPPPRHVFIGMYRGGRTIGLRTKHLIIGTPIGPNSAWLRTELLEQWKNGDTDIEVFNYSTKENASNLQAGYLEKFEARLSEKEKAVRLHGQWSDIDGLALAHLFDESVHVLPYVALDERAPCIVAIDPHPSKKHFAIMLAADKQNRLYAVKELSVKQVPREFANTLAEWMEGHRVIDIVCDNLGSSEMTGGEGFKSFIQVLQEEGVRVRPTSYDEKVDAEWIQRIQDALLIPEEADGFGERIPKLRMSASCRTLISDIKNVQWVKIKNKDEYRPTLDISNKDALACLKYALAANLFYDKPKHSKPVYRGNSLYGLTNPERKQSQRVAIRLRHRRANID